MDLARIIISEKAPEQLIVLKERDGDRNFPILIGILEAVAIDHKIKKIKPSRPMTHDLMENVIKALGATLESVVINALIDKTFFAQLNLVLDGKNIVIDSRSSDAIIMALHMNSPIFVDEDVLSEVSSEQ